MLFNSGPPDKVTNRDFIGTNNIHFNGKNCADLFVSTTESTSHHGSQSAVFAAHDVKHFGEVDADTTSSLSGEI